MLLRFAGKIAPLLLSALCFSCADKIFEDFEVKDTFIAGGNVCALFSAPIDPSSAKENFLFAQDDVQVDGKTLFWGNTLLFVPREKISKNHTYKIQIFSGAKDQRGNSLQRDYVNTFHTKSDLTRPRVLQAKIQDGALEIEFTKAINQKSFLESFSVEPQKEFFSVWNIESSKVKIEFKAPLLERQLYSVKIQAGLLDAVNNKMENDFFWSWTNKPCAPDLEYEVYGFKVGSGEKEILCDVLDGADFDRDFEIVFNKEVDSESLSGAICAEENLGVETRPQICPQGKYCKSALVRFKEKPKWGKDAFLFISQNIRDKSGGRAKERKITLKNNAEEKRPPVLEFVALKAGSDFCAMDKESAWTDISFPVDEYPEGEEKEIAIYFVYSISAKSGGVERLSAMEATSVQTNSCAAISLKTMEIQSGSGSPFFLELRSNPKTAQKVAALEEAGKALSLVKCGATFKNRQKNEMPARGVIEFKVSQKLCDDKKNYMEEAALFSCDKD